MITDESIYFGHELPPDAYFFFSDSLVQIYREGNRYGWICDYHQKYPETYVAKPLYTQAKDAYKAAKLHVLRSNIFRKFRS